ncbi:MAG: hypothetical protein QM820_33015 [Minicystis sp.]
MTRYGDYLSLYEGLPEDWKSKQGERPKLARARREKLAPEVPALTIALASTAPPRTVVTRDGEVMSSAALGVSLPVDPGEHVLTTQVPGGPIWEQRITIGKGEKKKATLDVKVASMSEPPPVPIGPLPSVEPAADKGPSGRRVASYVVGGIGIAGLVAGGVLGGLTLAKRSTVDQHCGPAIGSKDEGACDPAGLAAGRDAKGLGLGSTIGFAAGAAGIVSAAVLLLTEPKQPGNASGARGARISLDVLSAGPTGGVVGARGAW